MASPFAPYPSDPGITFRKTGSRRVVWQRTPCNHIHCACKEDDLRVLQKDRVISAKREATRESSVIDTSWYAFFYYLSNFTFPSKTVSPFVKEKKNHGSDDLTIPTSPGERGGHFVVQNRAASLSDYDSTPRCWKYGIRRRTTALSPLTHCNRPLS